LDRIKSAWEIALERAQRMEVTPEELKRQKEERCALAGEAIAQKYLDGFDLQQLREDLGRQPAEDRELVARAAARKLADSLELGDYELLARVVEGVALLRGEGGAEKARALKGSFSVLYDSYRSALRKKTGEVEAAGRAVLARLGVSGEAVAAINPAVNREWAQALEAVARSHEKEFARYKEELASGS
jgi:hypothetical protein